LLVRAINYEVLLVWFLFFIRAHDLMYRLQGKWFRLSIEQFDAFIVPLLALQAVG